MVTQKEGRRWTTCDHLLERNFPNLNILTKARVDRILFQNKTAFAVKFRYLGNNYFVKSKMAVILAAGTVGSSKLLMLSGIGPSSHLRKVGIKVIQDLPVGDNLQDQPVVGYDMFLTDKPAGLSYVHMLHPHAWLDYWLKATGPLTSVGTDLIGFINTKLVHCNNRRGNNRTVCYDTYKNDRPDIQFVFKPFGVTVDEGVHLRKLFGITDQMWDNYYSKNNETSLSFLPVLLHPRSKGTVRLSNRNPASMPLINPNYLSHPHDIKIMLYIMSHIRKIVDSSFKEIIRFKQYERQVPCCEKWEFTSQCYKECYLKEMTTSFNTLVGTCKMGVTNDSVVDYDFRVQGVKQLFVVDASVFPTEVSGEPMGSVIMMAERASDAIKKYRDITAARWKMFSRKKFAFNTF